MISSLKKLAGFGTSSSSYVDQLDASGAHSAGRPRTGDPRLDLANADRFPRF